MEKMKQLLQKMESDEKTVKVKLDYYRAGGKWYTKGELIVPEHFADFEIHDVVRELLKDKDLPGLVKNHSGFIVHVPGTEDGPGRIILPEKWTRILSALEE